MRKKDENIFTYGRIFVLVRHEFSITKGFYKAHGMLSKQNDFSINTHELVDFLTEKGQRE
jgi:hypothetical protein